LESAENFPQVFSSVIVWPNSNLKVQQYTWKTFQN